MRLKPFVDRLKAERFSNVFGVLEFVALTAPPAGTSFYVVPESEDARPNNLVGSGALDQQVAATFMVVIVMPGTARNPDAVSDALEEAKQRVITVIAGWTHPDASRACELAGGRLLSASGSTVAWGVMFRTAWRLRKT